MQFDDTIVALATPPGRGAIGVVRISGSGVRQVATALIGNIPEPRRARRAIFRDEFGEAIDEGLALYFKAPLSFTGEDVLELQGHGGPVVIDRLQQRLLALGCRLARPGEFSERAFLNDKIDLAQAEGIADLIDAGTEAAARAAMRTLQGEFSSRVGALERAIMELRVFVEAAIDFPDEEIDFLDDSDLERRLSGVFEAFDSIQAAAKQGVALREGLRVVIAGKPNAGKSSLMNVLAGQDVAIVTEIPGTTRDLLRQHIDLDGVPVYLTDTAGLRESQDPIEVEGVRRARAEMTRADVVIYVVDAGAASPTDAELAAAATDGELLVVLNKIDLHEGIAAPDYRATQGEPPGCMRRITPIRISARTQEGLPDLRQALKHHAGAQRTDAAVFTARRRHLDALARARVHTNAAIGFLRQQRAYELFAEELRQAQLALGEITGVVTSEDLLGGDLLELLHRKIDPCSAIPL